MKKSLAVVTGTVVVAVPVAAGVVVLLDPLGRQGDQASFIQVSTLDRLEEGVPLRVQVVADRTDAWNRYPQVPIGAAYLVRQGGNVRAFNVTCPHAGCPVEFVAGVFQCPCHESAFEITDGSLRPGGVSPRGLDELEVDADGLSQGVVRIKFQNFLAGTSAKVPQS